MRRQTSTSGSDPAGSSRVVRLDPLSLPVAFDALDYRADDQMRHIELHADHAIIRRRVSGMRMSIDLRIGDFIGVGIRDDEDQQLLVLEHRDPSLSIPLGASNDSGAIQVAWRLWSATFSLPRIDADGIVTAPAPRRRRSHPLHARRPQFLLRRRGGDPYAPMAVYRNEEEITAPD